MGIRYSDWLLGAPSIETGIAASSMAQDEWGHARLLYAMLKDFGMDPAAVEHERAAEEYANPEALDEPLADWAAVVAACVIVDGALSVALEGFSEGVYEPTRSRIPKMLDEETFHHDLGVAWFRKLAGGSEEGRSRLREAALSMLARTLAWLTPADEVGEAQGRVGAGSEGGRAPLPVRRTLRGATLPGGHRPVGRGGGSRRVGSRAGQGTWSSRRRIRGTRAGGPQPDAVRRMREVREATPSPGGLPESPSCPFCEGVETELLNPFGSQLSVSSYWCRDCRSPFEIMKWRGIQGTSSTSSR